MLIPVKLHGIWRRITTIYGRSQTARHSRTLEFEIAQQRALIASQQNEIARLRAENRALLNSILGIAGIPPLPSSVPFPTKCHSESAAADDESRSTPPHPSSTVAEKNSPGTQRPRNDIPPNSSPESSSLRSSAPSPSSAEGQGFSPDINDRREAPSSLPKAVQEGLPGRRLVEPGRSDGERPQRQGFSPRQPSPRRQLAAPLRRRSWHQIMRTLEFESGKKKAATD